MQISSYPGCTVLEGKPIAMPGAQAGSQSLPSSQHCPTTGMPQQHPPGSGANRPAGQQAPQRPSQAFQHMPRPPKLANFGRPFAQIRVKAEPSLLVHSSHLPQPQYLAPVADMAQPLLPPKPHPQPQSYVQPRNSQGLFQAMPMGFNRTASPPSMVPSQNHMGPIQTAKVLQQRQPGSCFVGKSPRPGQQHTNYSLGPQLHNQTAQDGKAHQHLHSGVQQTVDQPFENKAHEQDPNPSAPQGPTGSHHQRRHSDGQFLYSTGPSVTGIQQVYSTQHQQAHDWANGQASGPAHPCSQPASQNGALQEVNDHSLQVTDTDPECDVSMGMPSIPSQEVPQAQPYTSPLRNAYQATPFSAVSPPFTRYDTGPPVSQPHVHQTLLGPIHSAPEFFDGHDGLEFRMGSAGPNKSRYRGVSYDKKKRKWRVQIKVLPLGQISPAPLVTLRHFVQMKDTAQSSAIS